MADVPWPFNTEVQPASWCAYAPAGVSVVVGRYHDGSGIADEVYGPYPHERAEAVAQKLDGGQWLGMQWQALQLVRTPWDGASEVRSDG